MRALFTFSFLFCLSVFMSIGILSLIPDEDSVIETGLKKEETRKASLPKRDFTGPRERSERKRADYPRGPQQGAHNTNQAPRPQPSNPGSFETHPVNDSYNEPSIAQDNEVNHNTNELDASGGSVNNLETAPSQTSYPQNPFPSSQPMPPPPMNPEEVHSDGGPVEVYEDPTPQADSEISLPEPAENNHSDVSTDSPATE